MKLARPLTALAALAFALAPAAPPARAAEPVKITILTPATGSGAFLGKSYAETYRALTIAINKSGGIKGRPVQFDLVDTATSPQQGLQIVNGLIATKAPVFIDGGPSTVCSSSIPIVVNAGPVDFCLSPLVHPPTGSYVFSAGLAGTDQARMAIRYFRERGWTRIAMIASTDTTGQDLERQTDAALGASENKGVQLVAREHYNPADISVAAQIARIKGANPQAVIAWATGSPFGTVVHGLKDAGLELPLLTTNSNMTYSQMTAYTEFLPKELYFPALLAMTPEATGKGPLHDAQVAYVKSFSAIGVKPDEGHILAWDPTMMIVTALRAIGPMQRRRRFATTSYICTAGSASTASTISRRAISAALQRTPPRSRVGIRRRASGCASAARPVCFRLARFDRLIPRDRHLQRVLRALQLGNSRGHFTGVRFEHSASLGTVSMPRFISAT